MPSHLVKSPNGQAVQLRPRGVWPPPDARVQMPEGYQTSPRCRQSAAAPCEAAAWGYAYGLVWEWSVSEYTGTNVGSVPRRVGDGMSDDEKAVRELDQAWNEVYLRNDRESFGEILASDFRGAFPDGRTISKAELMRPTPARPVEFSEFGIDVFDRAAVTRGRIRVEHPERIAEQRFARIYMRRGDRWQAVAVYVFPIDSE